jgi:hypothetical protein
VTRLLLLGLPQIDLLDGRAVALPQMSHGKLAHVVEDGAFSHSCHGLLFSVGSQMGRDARCFLHVLKLRAVLEARGRGLGGPSEPTSQRLLGHRLCNRKPAFFLGASKT